jgi:hypothetical protein
MKRQLRALDETRVEALTAKLLLPVRDELARQPSSRDHVLVVLNALSACVALVLWGTEDNIIAHDFFKEALAANLEDLRRHGACRGLD